MKLEVVADLISRAAIFYQSFMETYERHRGSYHEDKQVRGRFGAGGEAIDITLMASDERRGLYGFRG